MTETMTGRADPLAEARTFAGSILYAPDTYLDTMTLAAAVSHDIALFHTLPRLLATSDDPESGKSTLLDVMSMLGFNAWDADEATGFAVKARFNEPEPTLFIVDEISKIFGTSGLRGQGHPLYKILVKGYRRTATASMSVDRTSVDVPIYSMAACAGLRTAAPHDLRTRCIIFPMKAMPADLPDMRSSVDPDTWAEGAIHCSVLHQWVKSHAGEIAMAYRSMRPPHRKLRGRLRQIWMPLFAVAQVAGGDWPARVLAAFRELALDASDKPVLSPAQMVLRDAAAIFSVTEGDRMLAADIAAILRAMPDVEIYRVLTDRRLAQLMSEALGQSTAMTVDGRRARGWHAAPVLAAWDKLEAELYAADVPDVVPDEFDGMFDVTEVTEVTVGKSLLTREQAAALGCEHAGEGGRFGTPRQCRKCPAASNGKISAFLGGTKT